MLQAPASRAIDVWRIAGLIAAGSYRFLFISLVCGGRLVGIARGAGSYRFLFIALRRKVVGIVGAGCLKNLQAGGLCAFFRAFAYSGF
jgi:hypothetical protein